MATAQAVLGTYTLVSGSFNGRGASYFQGLVGKGVDNTKTTSNYYSGGSGTIAVFTYNLVFSNIPSNAVITELYVEVNGHAESTSNSNEYMCAALYLGTSTAISNELNFKSVGTSNSTQTITATTLPTVAQLSDLRLRCRLGYYGGAINGATAHITYTVSDPRTITSTLSGNGTISPSGATTKYDGEEYEITITPTDITNDVSVTNNGTDVTSELVEHHAGGTSTSYSTASGSGVTTGFARSNSQFYRGNSSTTGDDWLRYAIGKTAESPYSTSNTSNTYCKDGTNDATTQGWMNYPFDFSSIPNDAEITSVEVKCYGAAESTSQSYRHADASVWCGNTQKGTTQRFSSTSNGTMTLSDPGEWTREELQDAWFRFGVGYYGGRILGITWKVNYTYGGTLHHYTYTYTVNGNATIAVTISTSTTPPTITVGTPSRSIISDETGYDQCVCTFRSNLALQQWEARATKAGVTPARGVGLLVESGTTLAANTDATIYVDDEELTQGDGEYTITVYGQSTGGVWSG